ncbi:hypothetical protein [Natrinema salinisoli]|uniref:hypothetical protein n=1 Tax=Natrinema salinisoli TaxID=2878535 RepID=UPI001CF043FE|nr:hypothetical protein [Natrinema salinisoli]
MSESGEPALQTPLCSTLEIEYPIVQAPIGRQTARGSRRETRTAVSSASGSPHRDDRREARDG